MLKRIEEMTIIEAYEEQDEVDEKIRSYFERRKKLRRRIKKHLPLLELMGDTEEKGTLL